MKLLMDDSIGFERTAWALGQAQWLVDTMRTIFMPDGGIVFDSSGDFSMPASMLNLPTFASQHFKNTNTRLGKIK